MTRPSDKSLANLIPIKPGVSGNPGGKPVGARNRLTAHFLNTLCADFEEHGKKAIRDAREQDPMRYVQVCATLMPKQIEASNPLEDVNDAELLAGIAFLRSRLTTDAGAGAAPAPEPSSVN